MNAKVAKLVQVLVNRRVDLTDDVQKVIRSLGDEVDQAEWADIKDDLRDAGADLGDMPYSEVEEVVVEPETERVMARITGMTLAGVTRDGETIPGDTSPGPTVPGETTMLGMGPPRADDHAGAPLVDLSGMDSEPPSSSGEEPLVRAAEDAAPDLSTPPLSLVSGGSPPAADSDDGDDSDPEEERVTKVAEPSPPNKLWRRIGVAVIAGAAIMGIALLIADQRGDPPGAEETDPMVATTVSAAPPDMPTSRIPTTPKTEEAESPPPDPEPEPKEPTPPPAPAPQASPDSISVTCNVFSGGFVRDCGTPQGCERTDPGNSHLKVNCQGGQYKSSRPRGLLPRGKGTTITLYRVSS